MMVNRLSAILGERRMSIMDLQRRSGVAYSTLHRLYTGKAKRIDLDTLDTLCRVLGVATGDILEYRE